MGSFATATRRGLVLTLYSEAPLAVGLVLFLLFPDRPAFLLFGFALAAIVGLPAGWSLWAGRREFGPAHARLAPAGAVAFVVLGLSLALALLETTSIFPETRRLVDLWGPWFFLGVALASDALAVALFLWHLAGTEGKRWIHLAWMLGLAGTIAYAGVGWQAMSDFTFRAGVGPLDELEAASYGRDFLLRVVRPFAAALLAIRLGFWPALWIAITNVADAEREAMAVGSDAGPPPARSA